jgi:hypothetical protein
MAKETLMDPISSLYRLAAIAALVLGLVAAGWAALHHYGNGREAEGVAKTTATYETALKKQKAEAAKLLDAERAKTAAAESALRQFKDEQEVKDGQHQATVNDLERRLRSAGGPSMRLRDPYATGCRLSGGSAQGATAASPGAGAADAAEGSGLLSKQLTALLFELARSADEINIAYASCRADAMNLRAAIPH